MVERRFAIRIGLSALIGMICGVVQAEIVANSLIEVADTKVFAIVFGVALLLLGGALLWRAWSVRAEKLKFGLLVAFALLVVASGVSCFFVTDLVHGAVRLSSGAKTPLFLLIGVALSFALTFCLVELLNADVFGKCCACFADEATGGGGVFRSRRQLLLVFIAALVMGGLYGVLFGSLDVEQSTSVHDTFELLLLVSLPIGLVFGGVVGGLNQWMRERFPESDEARRWATTAASRGDYQKL